MGFLGELTTTGPFSMSTLMKVGGAALAALVLLYILKLRLRTVEVPFSKLWSRVLKDTQSSSLWRRLKRLLSLLIQVLLVFLLLTAVTDPRSKAELKRGRHVLVLVDASASMQAVDGDLEGRGKGPFTRLEEAKVRVKEILATKRRRDKVMIVRMDSQVTPLNTWEDDLETLRRTVDKIQASDAPADMARALRFVADTLRPVRDPHLLIVGDGGYDPLALRTVYWGTQPPPDLLEQAPVQRGEIPTREREARKAGKKPSEKAGGEKSGEKKVDKDGEKAREARGARETRGAREARPRGETEPPRERPRPRPRARTRGRGDEPPPDEKPKKRKAPKPPPLGGGAYLDPIGLGKIKVSSLLVGEAHENVGIVAFNARRYLDDKLNYEVFAQIKNYRKKPVTLTVQLYSGGQIPDTSLLTLEPGQTRTYIKRDLPASGANLTMKLTRRGGMKGRLDSFPLDDVAYALIPERSSLKVLLVSKGNLFLEGALLLDEHSSYDKIPHEEYTAAKTGDYDVVVFDGYSGEELPRPGNYLIFNPDPKKSPIPVAKEVKNPPIFWPSQPKHKRHQIMQYVTIKNVNTLRSSVFKLGKNDEPLMMTDERGPVFAAVRREKGLRVVVVGFSVRQTDWVIRVSFPIFVLDALSWFAGDDPRLIPTYRTGRTWRIPVDVAGDSVEAAGPKRKKIEVPVQGDRALLYGRYVGYYTLFPGKQRLKVAANLANVKESNVSVPEALWLGGRKYGKEIPKADLSKGPQVDLGKASTGGWVLLILLLLLGLALVVVGLLVGATGPIWVFLGVLSLSIGVVASFYFYGMYLWTALLVGVLVVLLAEWLTYNRRVTV